MTLRARITRAPLWQRLTGAALALLVLAVGGLLAYDAATDTQDEIAERCTNALDQRPDGDTSRPDACQGLTDDNWTLVHMHWVLDQEGAFDNLP
jgi:hypothetical protein